MTHGATSSASGMGKRSGDCELDTHYRFSATLEQGRQGCSSDSDYDSDETFMSDIEEGQEEQCRAEAERACEEIVYNEICKYIEEQMKNSSSTGSLRDFLWQTESSIETGSRPVECFFDDSRYFSQWQRAVFQLDLAPH